MQQLESFSITREGRVIFADGTTWEDIPTVTGDDIREYRESLHYSLQHFASFLELASGQRVGQLEKYGHDPIPDRLPRVRFLLLREANIDPALLWTPKRITIRMSDVVGYLHEHVCGVGPIEQVGTLPLRGCGKVYWSTNRQRIYCGACAPYEGDET